MNTPERSFSSQKPFIKVVQIFLLILIVIGVTLLATQKHWVPQVVEYIIASDEVETVSNENVFTVELYAIQESVIYPSLGEECADYHDSNGSMDALLMKDDEVVLPSLLQAIYSNEPTCPHAELDFVVVSADENYLVIQDSPVCKEGEESCEVNYKFDLSTMPPTLLSVF